jgi:uncharacterized protein (DUF433 family)
MNWREHITSEPEICHGKACIKGTRVLVSILLDHLAAGDATEDVAKSYDISIDAVRAALAYAADVAGDRVFDLPAA